MTVEGRKSRVEGTKPALRSTLDARRSTARSGIALVITLILLSVTLVMAVAFLAISNRERSSVTTTTDATTARLAAETALAQAESQILSQMLTTTNPYIYGLIVSTNYINPNGFNTGISDPLNVNYDYYVGGRALSTPDLEQNIANLFLNPRVPVFITTNQSSGVTDFRFYLDLNRNGVFDTNGNLPTLSSDPALPYVDKNGLNTASLTNAAFANNVGDPEWIGVLERPDTTHGPNNKFLSRYVFAAIPIGNALDMNYIYNDATRPDVTMTFPNDGFMRNEGVGTWEINLAAFLTDLNTNQWLPPSPPASGDPYIYGTYNGSLPYNRGVGFEDAFSLLKYRYGGTYANLAFGTNAFLNNGIDEYASGNLMINTMFTNQNNVANYWSGSENVNHFFTLGDLFDSTKVAPANFINHLRQAGTNVSTYDRYTYYRMLDQLGTDSTPESGLMNVNYDNLTPTNGVAGTTNYLAWTPIGFFTNAVDRMLKLYTTNWFYASLTRDTNDFTTNNFLATYYGIIYTNPISADQYGNVYGMSNSIVGTNLVPAFGFANIPVMVNGQFVYSPAVNRILQLAANMYCATTNNSLVLGYNNLPLGADLPNVFKPVFCVTNGNVYITNFVEVTDTTFFNTDTIRNINNGPGVVAALQPNDLVFGVPLIIGAKKGFPNFNEFYMENTFQLTRKLLVTRQSTNVPVPVPANFFSYYEQFSLSLSNHFGVEMWNSYRSNYSRLTDIYVTNYVTMTLTNDENNYSFTNYLIASGYLQFGPANPWPAYNPYFPTNSFQIPLATNFPAVPSSIYLFNSFAPAQLVTNLAVLFQTNYPTTFGQYPQPHWGMTITNNLQVIMVDTATHRLIDYVQLGGPNTSRDLSAEIQNEYDTAGTDTGYNNLWNPYLSAGGAPIGITEQLKISQGGGNPVYSATLWGESQKMAYDQMNAFRIFTLGKGTFLLNYPGYVVDPTQIAIAGSTNALQAAYTPTATVVQDIVWQVNDPLVHYLASDLNNPSAGNGLGKNLNWPGNLGLNINPRYMPWGGNPLLPAEDSDPYTTALKDPLVASSDYWDFPTNKFPTIGWFGRVHRGTPWQTVYLKASDVDRGTWTNRTGNVIDAGNTVPVQDRLLFDLFTTAPNDNATRGQLSVNVGAEQDGHNLAAWSALFSGMVVPATSPSNTYSVISPAGAAFTGSRLGKLVQGINAARSGFKNSDGVKGVFEHKGDILATPELTEKSPFLDLSKTNYNTDEMYEWLPQQAMSLLRAPSAPRYVLYGWGQALKPALNGIVTSSSTLASGLNPFGMITNYQVVTESAVRAVIRVEGANTPSPHIVVESINRLPPD